MLKQAHSELCYIQDMPVLLSVTMTIWLPRLSVGLVLPHTVCPKGQVKIYLLITWARKH